MKRTLWLVGFVVAAALNQGDAKAGNFFSDNFEGATLNPYWTASNNNGGLITFPANDLAHSGTQSLKFQSIATGGPEYSAQVSHTYSTPTFGTFQVWMYDSYPGNNDGNYGLLTLGQDSAHGGRGVSVGIMDFDGASYWVGGDVTQSLSHTRTLGWHLLSIVDLPNQLTVSVDGIVGYSASGYAIELVSLNQFAPSWRQSGLSTNWDDFSADILVSAPAPSSLTLFSIATVCLAVYYGFWRRKLAVA
jgi:hypothetical protein